MSDPKAKRLDPDGRNVRLMRTENMGMGWRGFNVKTRFVDGRRVEERLPATAHVGGDYDDPTPHPLGERRFVVVCTHHGNTIALTLTNAAGHTDISTPWAGYQRAKARYFGWFPVEGCLVRHIKNGVVRKDKIVATELLDERVCEKSVKTCKHTRAEIDARRAAQAATMAELERRFKSTETRQRESLGSDIATAIATALGPVLAEIKKGAE